MLVMRDLSHAYPFRPFGEDGGRSNFFTVLCDPADCDPTAATARHKWRGGQWLPYTSGAGDRIRQDLQALEQKLQDVADLRRIWIGKRQPFMARHLERLAFIDETSVKTNMAKTTG